MLIRWLRTVSRNNLARVNMTTDAPTIAIDGPAGSGKTTVGKMVADRLGYKFLDTGLMYRVATWIAIEAQANLGEQASIISVVESSSIDVGVNSKGLSTISVGGVDLTERLHTFEIDSVVSTVSAIPRIREIMVAEQKKLAGNGGIVMVGRDIGTVVVPDSPIKIFLTASAATRATRRFEEFGSSGEQFEFNEILESIEQRDKVDSSRSDSPLRPADDADVIETDDMNLEEVVARVMDLVVEKMS